MFCGFPIPLDGNKKYRIRTQTITATTTWYRPSNLWGDCVWISGCGGGGAGGGTNKINNYTVGGGGGSGCWCMDKIISISGIASVIVTIGLGGTGVSQADGGNGGNTTFGSLYTLIGGYGGKYTGSPGIGMNPGGPGIYYSNTSVVYYSGYGGSTPWGLGGDSKREDGNGISASSNTGAGGSGAYDIGAGYKTGGNGGSGILIIAWFEEY